MLATGLSTWLPKSMLKLRPFWYDDMYPTYWNGEVVGRGGGLPTLLCHGKADAFVPFELGRRSYKRAEVSCSACPDFGFHTMPESETLGDCVQKLGLAAELKRYEGMGHGLCREELYDVEFVRLPSRARAVLRICVCEAPRSRHSKMGRTFSRRILTPLNFADQCLILCCKPANISVLPRNMVRLLNLPLVPPRSSCRGLIWLTQFCALIKYLVPASSP